MSAKDSRYPPLPSGADVEMLAPDLALLSFPLSEPVLPASLTEAERDVTLQIFRGATNAQIARARGVTVRTIAKQLDSIYRKVGVSSRTELIALLLRT